MNNNKLFRNTSSKVLGGVASGIADYLDIDVTVVRILFVLGVFIPVTFPIILLYVILWIVMPDGAKRPKPFEQTSMSS
jgi:phage shock protein C